MGSASVSGDISWGVTLASPPAHPRPAGVPPLHLPAGMASAEVAKSAPAANAHAGPQGQVADRACQSQAQGPDYAPGRCSVLGPTLEVQASPAPLAARRSDAPHAPIPCRGADGSARGPHTPKPKQHGAEGRRASHGGARARIEAQERAQHLEVMASPVNLLSRRAGARAAPGLSPGVAVNRGDKSPLGSAGVLGRRHSVADMRGAVQDVMKGHRGQELARRSSASNWLEFLPESPPGSTIVGAFGAWSVSWRTTALCGWWRWAVLGDC